MAYNTEATFAFELVQKLYDNDVCKKEDVIILFVHWYLIKCGFKCLGFGDSKTFSPEETGSELLPTGWNSHPNYALRYLRDKRLYILHSVKSDSDLLLNLLRVEDNRVANAQFPIDATVTNLHGPLKEVIPTYHDVIRTLNTDLLTPLCPCNQAENSVQTVTDRPGTTVRPGPRVGPVPLPAVSPPFQRDDPLQDPTRVGVSDLNPFARGGGMIYDPFSRPVNPRLPDGLGVPGRLPPGAIPPGARFDPFGPADLSVPRRRPPNPDDDHLPPPGYDDMFM